jgi:lipopolysaccharide/colanic/teichoic acid biosynthesis glycosyltransferase
MESQTRRWQKVVGAVVALGSLFVLWPLIVLVAIAIKLTSAGPVFVAREGFSQNETRFTYRVFRTRDVRTSEYTAVGRFLRTSNIDLLPRLWSLLGGPMTLRDILGNR